MLQISKFKTGKRLQQATIQYIVEQLASSEEIHKLEQVFKTINISNSGKITKEELIIGFDAQTEEAIREVEKMFDEVDVDGSGEIEFSEWIVASIDKNSLITEEKLRQAFSLFDTDGSGTIRTNEIKATLTGCQDNFDEEEDRMWAEIIDEVDIDGDGEIDFEEFS